MQRIDVQRKPRAAAAPRYCVTIYVRGRRHLYHIAKIYSGLVDLERNSEIRLTVRLGGPYVELALKDRGLWIEATELDTGVRRSLCVDLRDRSDVFTRPLLERCDLYMKRSYFAPHVAALPFEMAARWCRLA